LLSAPPVDTDAFNPRGLHGHVLGGWPATGSPTGNRPACRGGLPTGQLAWIDMEKRHWY